MVMGENQIVCVIYNGNGKSSRGASFAELPIYILDFLKRFIIIVVIVVVVIIVVIITVNFR